MQFDEDTIVTVSPELAKRSKTKEYLTIEILEKELRARRITPKFNVISNGIELPAGFDLDTLPIELMSDLRPMYNGVSQDVISSMILSIAKKYTFNPVMDMIKSNKWDGKDHMKDVYDSLNVAEDDTLSRTLIYKWFWQGLSLIRNTQEEPFGADGVLTLSGKQGLGKTSFFRKIAVKHKFFRAGQKLDNFDKDKQRRCITTWICELGEIDSTFKRSDIGTLKAFITNEYDEYRLPYGRVDQQVPRRTNMGATVNGTDYLVDPTGNRRFWTVDVPEVDFDALNRIDALQCWMQVWEENAKDNIQGFRLTREEQNQLADRNSRHESRIPGEDEIRDIFAKAENNEDFVMEYMTASDFKLQHSTLGKYNVSQIGKVLDKMGIKKERKSVNGKQDRYRKLPCRVVLSESKK